MSSSTGITRDSSSPGEPSAATDPDTNPAAGQPADANQPNRCDVAARPMIAVALLAAHPGNVRRDMALTAEFVASVEANGILVPLRITRDSRGGYRVIDGHRRLAAAIKIGLAEVPVDLAEDRAGDESGQYLDMWTSHRHRAPLTLIEEADALFAAHEAGASKTRIRKSTGLKPPQVGAALAAARLSGETRETVEALPQEMTLEGLAIFAEFDGDAQAIARLSDVCRWGGSLEHQAELLRQERAERAEHERLCEELTNAGVTLTDALPPGAQLLVALQNDGDDLTPETHAGCPGRGAFFRSYDPTTPVHYCAEPATHGHTGRGGGAAGAAATTNAAGAHSSDGTHGPGDPDPERPDPARRLVIEGNKAWKAAAEVRKRWLTAHLFARRTAPREAAPFVARQLLAMPDPLRQGLAPAHSRLLFSEITGHHADRWAEACDITPAARLPLLMLGPIIVAYEQAMTEGEGKNTWRTDRYSPCPRPEAGRYLAFVASVGYELSAIEQSVASGTPYTGDTEPSDPLTADGDPGSDPSSADRPVRDGDHITSEAEGDTSACPEDVDGTAGQAAA